MNKRIKQDIKGLGEFDQLDDANQQALFRKVVITGQYR
jgi:hypothetical protein